MLAFAWPWDEAAPQAAAELANRLAASLCAGIGGAAAARALHGMAFAARAIPNDPQAMRRWHPAQLPGGRFAALAGYLDNADELAVELGCTADDPALLYGLAVERWGIAAEGRLIGEYCALIADPQERWVRLSRSPLRAPPLHYAVTDQLVAAASVPRALFAAGIERRLDEARSADSALLNFTSAETTWFEGVAKVPLGSVVTLRPRQERQLETWYDLLALPDVHLSSDADYIERANALLREAVAACLKGARRPGSTLSSGLDSSQVVAHALQLLPESQTLPTFTFHPEAEWDAVVEDGMNGNERPMVEAFAAMHPRIEPHFTANQGYGHDHRWNEFFHLMGGAPSGLCNMYVFHGLFTDARKAGCDRLLLAEWGNYTFSDKGEWAFVELLLKGRWRQYYRALKNHPNDPRSMLRKFLALSVMPLLPNWLWKLVKRIVHPGEKVAVEWMTPLRKSYREQSGADERYRASGLQIDRYHPRSRREGQALLFQNHDAESAEIYLAFEQLYDLPMRDPTAYRPLVEFCLGLPVELFVRDGVPRWLAKQMARGIMPEHQRENQLNGRWDADWHHRIRRQRADYLEELDRIAEDPRLAEMIDIERLRAALEDFPEQTTLDMKRKFAIEFALPRGLLAARYVRWVEGRN